MTARKIMISILRKSGLKGKEMLGKMADLTLDPSIDTESLSFSLSGNK